MVFRPKALQVLLCTLIGAQSACLSELPSMDLTPLALLSGGSAASASGSSATTTSAAANIEVLYDTTTLNSGTYANLDVEEVGTVGAPFVLTIRNSGEETLTINSVAGTGGVTGDYTVTTTSLASSLSGGASTTFSVAFAPTTTGTRNMQLTIASDDADQGNFILNFSGDGVTDIVHVTTSGSDGGGDGSQANPFGTIGHGVATVLPGGVVRVGEGTYQVTTPIDLEDNKGIIGGYDTTTWIQDTWNTPTNLEEASTTGGIALAPLAPIRAAGAGVTATAYLQGIHLYGSTSGATHTAGMVITGGAAPTIRGVEFVGGDGTESFGIFIEDSSPDIQWSVINGGTATSISSGVFVTGAAADPNIRHNYIIGGDGDVATGMLFNTSAGQISDNQVIGSTGGGGTSSFGVQATVGTTVNLWNNTINAGAYPLAVGIRMLVAATPTIQNNVIFTGNPAVGTKVCVHEVSSSADPAAFQNNLLIGCNTGLYDNENGTMLATIAAVNALGDTTSSGNVSTNPFFLNEPGGNFQLSSSTPTSITEGGLDLSGDGVTLGLNGVPRTVPFSIGAHEYNN